MFSQYEKDHNHISILSIENITYFLVQKTKFQFHQFPQEIDQF